MFTELILEDKKRTDIQLVSENGNFKTYKFDLCGHTKNYTKDVNLSSGARCNDCYEDKISLAANALGLDYIGELSGNKREREFVFKKCGHTKLMQPSKVLSPYSNSISCGECQLELFKKEATSRGYEYLGKTSDPNYKQYLCLTCSTVAEYQPQHMRSGNATCKTCYENSLADDLDKINCDLVGTPKRGEYMVRFRSCGHTVLKNSHGVRSRKTDWCPTCADNAFQERLDRLGITPTGIGSGRNREYLIRNCGHSVILRTDEISRGTLICSICDELSFKKKVESFGLHQLPIKASKTGFRVFKLPCGCTQELGMFSAKIGRWNCRQCNESHYNKESSVYLIKFSCEDFEWLKLGFSKNIDTRIVGYKMREGCTSELVEAVSFTTGLEAVRIEKNLHSIYRELRLPPEDMRKYHTRNGFTECYPIGLSSVLKEELIKYKET